MKEYRRSGLIVSESGEVTYKSTGKPVTMGSKGYVTGPGMVRTHQQLMDELYPGNIVTVCNTIDTTVCNNKGRFRKAVDNPKFKGWFKVGDTKYPSTRIAAIMTGISPKTIYNRCAKGKPGYSFIPK
jgi:hypothetical protein